MQTTLLVVIIIVLVTFRMKRPIPDERNCSYLIDGEVVTLVDGRSVAEIVEGSASKQVTDFIISKGGPDLNGDGRGDSAVFLRQRSGGSGTFYFIAAAFSLKNGYEGTNAVFLGDRIEPLDIEFDGDIIIVTYLDRLKGESFSEKPSDRKVIELMIEDGVLLKF
jgi:hypothetical protein